jgi:hypothetical protein
MNSPSAACHPRLAPLLAIAATLLWLSENVKAQPFAHVQDTADGPI